MFMIFLFLFVVQTITSAGVCKVLDSSHPDFKVGDYVWAMTRWEEYSLITSTKGFFKIRYPELSLSHYTSFLGKYFV